ncbi:hypothetical protein C8P69_11916 [Phreatobacter oligotrophus]|uniref:Uncharacterized protein n=1 Tax=Phreatobacter oligotrophus TaxID=1122261 RepID=A0A2T4YWS2_9HYPH|nr:hypothetical protein C8P69_11916 [Phreatobacter oligotrophus]
MILGVLFTVIGLGLILVALPRGEEARGLFDNSLVAVTYHGTVLGLLAFGIAFIITGALSR